MYHVKLWDEDKWNIHSQSYSSSKYGNAVSADKKDDKKYHEQKYGSKEKDVSSDYIRKEEAREKEENKSDNILEEAEEAKKEQEIKEDEILFKAAKEVFSEQKNETRKSMQKKNINTIEDAIKKAIEEEKDVIVMD